MAAVLSQIKNEVIKDIEKNGVPDSCIESAEYIIQRVHNGLGFVWSETVEGAPTSTPHVYAVFGGNRYFNMSDDDGWLTRLPADLADYPFQAHEMPQVGEGLCLVNYTKFNNKFCDYDMHFGAILSNGPVFSEISDNCAKPVTPTPIGALKKAQISTPADFRKTIKGAGGTKTFALGKLTITPPAGGTHIKA